MKALVTGATGLVGSHLVRGLLAAGYEVRALARHSSDLSSLRKLTLELHVGDVLDPGSLMAAAEGCDYVFHTAAVFAYWGHTLEELEGVAVSGTRNVLTAAKEAGVQRAIVTSSSVTMGYGSPTDIRTETSVFEEKYPPHYTLSKVHQEQAALDTAAQLNLNMVVVCPTLTIGGHDYRLSPSNRNIVNYLNDPLRSTFQGGCNLVAADDVARGHIIAAEKGQSGCRYLVGADNLRWREVHHHISALAGTFGPSVTLNNTATYLAASAAEVTARFTGDAPLVTRDEAVMSGQFFWYSSATLGALGYRPESSYNALAQAIAWVMYRAYLSESVIDRLSPLPVVIDYYNAFAGKAA